jgi:Uma2 family endonuclease
MVRLPAQSDPPLSPRQTLPTMYDLPSENPEEPGLPDEFHGYQPLLLRYTFKPANCDPEEVFIGADINLYYDLRHPNWYKRPDWFAVVGVSRLYEGHDLRLSYVLWQEWVSPFVVVELLSPGTEQEDLGRTAAQKGKPPIKWQVYEQILRVPYYIVFSRYTNELRVFRLVGGAYEPAH